MGEIFLSVDREQGWLMPPSVRDWLPDGHLAWFVLDAVEQLDLEAFYEVYRRTGDGRPAHDPRMMVGLLLYAYSVGELSSRQIERRCEEDVAFRVIAANRVPDHTTIARFRARHDGRLADLFEQVLALCAKAGMVKVGKVAVDGTKVRANAGIGANRSYSKIREEVDWLLGEAAAVDAAEDRQFGELRGDELPPELADGRSRRARLERAKRELEQEEAERQAAHQAQLDAHRQYRERTGRRKVGRQPRPTASGSSPLENGKRNITDPDSRIMSDRGALVQAYNAQAIVGEGQVILAHQVTNIANDHGQLEPMFCAARANLDRVGVSDPIKCLLADGGYWHRQQITATRQAGTTVVIPTHDPHTTKRKRKPRQGPEAERIDRILNTAAGRRLYRRRAQIVEPVFAHSKHTRRITQFCRRGLDAAGTEWALITTTHNLLKLFRYQPQIA